MPPLRALQALCWLAFLGLVLVGGHAGTYVVAWQTWLVLGAMVLLALGVVGGLLAGPGQEDHHGHDHAGHDHPSPSWIETGVHTLPLVLFLAVGPSALGSHALAINGEIDTTTFIQAAPATSSEVDGYTRTDLLALRHDPFLDGGRVEVIARLGQLAEQTTRRRRSGPPPLPRPVLFRHVISCCAADGQPIYAWLTDPPSAHFPVDTWVRVRGTLDTRATGGVIPVITVEMMEAVPQPEQAYLIVPGTVAAPGHVPIQ